MEQQFHGYGETGRDTGQGVRFAQEIQQAMGEDFELDPQFLEESWTVGVAAATESWQRRQRNQVEHERQSRAFRELDSLGGLNFVQASDWVAALRGAWNGSMAAVATDAGMLAHHGEDPAAEWSGRQPEQERRELWEYGDGDGPMTQPRACRLLGVDTGSTREQIRAAYRRMASQWHPDRRMGEVGGVANERMARINEAYRLLREGAMEEAA
jgi:hypothetical protein